MDASKFDACKPMLAKLKVALTKFGFLPSSGASNKKELLLAREILEIGAQWSVRVGDADAFERYMSQVKVYYFDFGGELPESVYMHELMGLYLLSLLSENRIGEFHTELERLDPALLPVGQGEGNIYISYPVHLEQYLMEGSYNKVFLLKENVPADTYKFFVEKLLLTLREEIADGIERAYLHLSVKDTARLLFVKDSSDVTAMAAEREGWTIAGDKVVFAQSDGGAGVLPSESLIDRSLSYAREMEKIV